MTNTQIRNLLFLLTKRFFTSSATSPHTTTTTSSSSFTVQFLLNSCGLPLKSAISVSQKLQLDEQKQQRSQSVLDLLKSFNFSDTQLANLIVKAPSVLHCKANITLQPKFEYLTENGFVGKLLPELILADPLILISALDSHIKPRFEILRKVLSNNENIIAVTKRSPWLLRFDLKGRMQPNINFLIKEGVLAHRVGKLIMLQPRVITGRHGRMVYAVNAVKNLGLEPTSCMFIHAVRVIMSMSELTWKRKFEFMKRMGWNEEEILSAFKRSPLCLTCSEEKIKNVMDFYVNTVKLEPQAIIADPILLMYAVETRLRPRYNVLKVLQSKDMIKGNNKKIVRLLKISEREFLEKYVSKYADEVPGIKEMYLGTRKAKEKDTRQTKK